MSEPCLELLTASEVAQWLRLKGSTLYSWAATGKIPCVNLNGTIRFIRSDIERWIEEHVQQAVGSRSLKPRLLVHAPRTISELMLKQASTRIMQRAKRQTTSGNSKTMPRGQKRKSSS